MKSETLFDKSENEVLYIPLPVKLNLDFIFYLLSSSLFIPSFLFHFILFSSLGSREIFNFPIESLPFRAPSLLIFKEMIKYCLWAWYCDKKYRHFLTHGSLFIFIWEIWFKVSEKSHLDWGYWGSSLDYLEWNMRVSYYQDWQ